MNKWYIGILIALAVIVILWLAFRKKRGAAASLPVSFEEYKDKLNREAFTKFQADCRSSFDDPEEANLCTRASIEGYLMAMNTVPQWK